jgi:hypothetical protein
MKTGYAIRVLKKLVKEHGNAQHVEALTVLSVAVQTPQPTAPAEEPVKAMRELIDALNEHSRAGSIVKLGKKPARKPATLPKKQVPAPFDLADIQFSEPKQTTEG